MRLCFKWMMILIDRYLSYLSCISTSRKNCRQYGWNKRFVAIQNFKTKTNIKNHRLTESTLPKQNLRVLTGKSGSQSVTCGTSSRTASSVACARLHARCTVRLVNAILLVWNPKELPQNPPRPGPRRTWRCNLAVLERPSHETATAQLIWVTFVICDKGCSRAHLCCWSPHLSASVKFGTRLRVEAMAELREAIITIRSIRHDRSVGRVNYRRTQTPANSIRCRPKWQTLDCTPRKPLLCSALSLSLSLSLSLLCSHNNSLPPWPETKSKDCTAVDRAKGPMLEKCSTRGS